MMTRLLGLNLSYVLMLVSLISFCEVKPAISFSPSRSRAFIETRTIEKVLTRVSSTPLDEDGDTDDDNDDQDYMLSPQQVKVLRKEVQKRKAKNSLKRLALTAEEGQGAFATETLERIAEVLQTETELLEIRAISKNQPKNVKAVSELLAIQVERHMDTDESFKPVFVLDIKGFSAVFYSPFLEDADLYGKSIVLRSGYENNKWTRKPKAIRDIRGQIITDKDGNIIRE